MKPGNIRTGEATDMQRCAACHKLFSKGGNLGPDLTSYQRDKLGTMLISIVNPDAEICEGYQYITVTEPPPTPGLRQEGSRGDEKGNSCSRRGLRD